jgi:flagellar motility protein MotE (MotC chaperone)
MRFFWYGCFNSRECEEGVSENASLIFNEGSTHTDEETLENEIDQSVQETTLTDAIFHFNKLKSYLLQKNLNQELYNSIKCLEDMINTDKKKEKYKTILDYFK